MTALLLLLTPLAGAALKSGAAAPQRSVPVSLARAAVAAPGAVPGVPVPAQPSAAAQLDSAQQSAKEGAPSDAERREFFERVFSGAAASAAPTEASEPPGPPPAPVEPLRADTVRLLEHIVWGKSPSGVKRRVDAVVAAGGIPETDWRGRLVSVQPLDADLLAELPALSRVLEGIRQGRTGSQPIDYALSDLLYSINVLAGREPDRPALIAALRWLWGTYRTL